MDMTLRDSLESDVNASKHKDVEFIQLRYTDVIGRFLAKYIVNDTGDPSEHLQNGIALDGSSVTGFSKIIESDLLLIPDRSTLRLMPLPNYKVATVIADVYEGFGSGRLLRDPRCVPQALEQDLRGQGLICQTGPEVECFVFEDIVFDNNGGLKIQSSERTGKYPIRRKHGYDAPPFQDSLLELRFEVAKILKNNYSIRVTNLNHEVASSGQIEINFMHKPIFDENNPMSSKSDNGSGMHVSVSLWSGGSNIFYDPNDHYAELSQIGRYFIGGVLKHASSLAALVAPTVNSYHRLVPGFEAPVYAAWSRGNRSAVLRVPVNEKNTPK